MMFQTSGLNTGKVRLETLITGFCWSWRREHRQGEARTLDPRLLLCVRRQRRDPAGRYRESKGERGNAAARQPEHGQFPLVVVQAVVLLVAWLECERDFTLLSFACK